MDGMVDGYCIYLLIYYSTTEHRYGPGHDYHDYDADMSFGMTTFLYLGSLRLETGVGIREGGLKGFGALAMSLRLYKFGISMTFFSIAAGLMNEKPFNDF